MNLPDIISCERMVRTLNETGKVCHTTKMILFLILILKMHHNENNNLNKVISWSNKDGKMYKSSSRTCNENSFTTKNEALHHWIISSRLHSFIYSHIQ